MYQRLLLTLMQPDNDKSQARLGLCQLAKVFFHCLKGCLNRTVPHTGLQFDLKFSFLSVHHIRDSLLGFASQLVDGELLLNTLLFLAMGDGHPKDRSEEKRLRENLAVLMDLVICRNFPGFRFGPDCLLELENDPVPSPFTEELFLDEAYQPTELELEVLRGVPLVRVRATTPEISKIHLNISPPPEDRLFSGKISRQSSAGNFFPDTKRSDLQTSSRLAHYTHILDPEHQVSVSREYDIANKSRYYSSQASNIQTRDFLKDAGSASKLTKKEQQIYSFNPLNDKKFDLGSILSGNKPLQTRVFQGLDNNEFKRMVKSKVEQLDHDRAKKRLETLGKEQKTSVPNFFTVDKPTAEKQHQTSTQQKTRPPANPTTAPRSDYKPKTDLSDLLSSSASKKKPDPTFKSKYFIK